MAFITIFVGSDTKGCLAVMAGAARFSRFHKLHANLNLAPFSIENAGVALPTLIKAGVIIMAEADVASIFFYIGNFLGRVTLGTFLNRKSLFGVVTRAAGFSFLHGCHSNAFPLLIGGIQFGVTFTTLSPLNMNFVTEMRGAGLFYLICYFLNNMTCGAFIETKGFFAIMACTTRFAFFHICHRITLLLF